MIGVEAYRPLEAGPGFFGLTQRIAHQAEVVVGIDQIRLNLNRSVEAQSCVAESSLVHQSQTEVVVDLGQIWTQVECLLEAQPRIVEVSLGQER